MTSVEKKNNVIQKMVKPLFKTAGFSVSGVTFKKNEEGFIKLFNIQSSQFNHEGSVVIYLNLGFLFPIGFEMSNKPLPSVPKIHDCQFSIRADSLTGRNQSYELTSDANALDFENLLKNDIQEQILPFFEKYKTIADSMNLQAEFPGNQANISPLIGMTMVKNGEIEKGDRILNASLSAVNGKWKNEIVEYRKRLER